MSNDYAMYPDEIERAETAPRLKTYDELEAELEAELAALREALTSISTALDAYGVRWCREVAKEALQEKGE
jgi:hypothetical protein